MVEHVSHELVVRMGTVIATCFGVGCWLGTWMDGKNKRKGYESTL